MKIAINFGDNDFHRTFFGVLSVFLHMHRQGIHIKKETALNVVNEISFGVHMATGDAYDDNTREYLKITADEIFIGEEVDAFLASGYCFDYGCFILDTNLDYPGNKPIYSV